MIMKMSHMKNVKLSPFVCIYFNESVNRDA